MDSKCRPKCKAFCCAAHIHCFDCLVAQLLSVVPTGAGHIPGHVPGSRPGAAVQPGRAAASLGPGALRQVAAADGGRRFSGPIYSARLPNSWSLHGKVHAKCTPNWQEKLSALQHFFWVSPIAVCFYGFVSHRECSRDMPFKRSSRGHCRVIQTLVPADSAKTESVCSTRHQHQIYAHHLGQSQTCAEEPPILWDLGSLKYLVSSWNWPERGSRGGAGGAGQG